jgi:EmrB/QacA subfamily drug resistance transporter
MSTDTLTLSRAATRGAAHAAPGAPWAALPVIVAGAFMVVLDFFVGNVALPSIAADLHASSGALEWIAAGYALTVAAFLITAGRLGDNLGRRRMYTTGIALFVIASVACGVAPSAGVLVAARVAQGLAGALLMPQVLAIIGVTFRGADRARAMGVYSMALGLAAVGGQLIGGALVQADVAGLGWRACYLINVPVGIAALVLTPRLVPESRAGRPSRLDLGGVALVTLAVLAITLPLIEGREQGWPAWTWVSFALAVVLAAGFVAHQLARARRGRPALLDLALFGERTFSAGLATQLLLWCGQAAFFVFLALYLQPGRGLDALQAGLVFTVVAVAYVVTSGAAPGLTERHGRRVPLAGAATLAAGHALLALAVAGVGVGGSVAVLVPGLLLVGAGMGLCLTSLNHIVLETLDEERAGSASGVLGTIQELGNALGVAVTGVVFFGAVDGGLDHAFALSAVELAVVGLAIAGLTRLLPAHTRA